MGYDHKYVYSHLGYNLKATDLQAAIGVAQLGKLESFIETRKKNFEYLYKRIKEYENYFILPRSTNGSEPSWFAFPLTVRPEVGFTRKQLVDYLETHKIMTRTLFAGNLTKHPAYLNVKKRIVSSLATTDNIMKNAFFIGIYPGITVEMLEYVGNVFDEFMGKRL